MTGTPNRVAPGTPAGGRFATGRRDAADLDVIDVPVQTPDYLSLPDNYPFAPLNVRIVMPGESYGRSDGLVNDYDEPLVEFYDSRFHETEQGQFISRYHLSSITGREVGLDLDGGIDDWAVTADNVALATTWATIQKKDWEERIALEEQSGHDVVRAKAAVTDQARHIVAGFRDETAESERKIAEIQAILDDPKRAGFGPGVTEGYLNQKKSLQRRIEVRKLAQLDELMAQIESGPSS